MSRFGGRIDGKRKTSQAVVDTSGGATTIDSVGSLEVNVLGQENNISPTESNSFGIGQDETNLTPAEAHEFNALVAEMAAAQSETSAMEAGVSDQESNVVPAETNLLEASASNSESNPVPSETSLSDISILNQEVNSLPGQTNLTDISVTTPESNPLPAETELLDVTANSSENAAAQADSAGSLELVGAESNSAPVDEVGNLDVSQSEPNSVPGETFLMEANAGGSETNPVPTESSQSIDLIGFGETNTVAGEGRLTAIQYWAVTSSDNDGGHTSPAGANGERNGSRANIKTNNSTLNTTNPVILTSTDMGIPATPPPRSGANPIRLHVFGFIAARTAALDTILYQYLRGGDTTWTTFRNHNVASELGNFSFQFTGNMTDAQLDGLQLRVSYQASVVATPETMVELDAWCVEIDTTL